jgi:hypothetical protein
MINVIMRIRYMGCYTVMDEPWDGVGTAVMAGTHKA